VEAGVKVWRGAVAQATSTGASREPRRIALLQLNILQTVVFSDHTHAVCKELS
jgi:hypothetical protein